MSIFSLGAYTFDCPVILAPMAGVTDRSFRVICRSYGADFCVSEMISAKGMYYNDEKTGVLAKIDSEASPCAVQIFGSDPGIMAIAARRLCEGGYKGDQSAVRPFAIDINMGCPVHKIVSNGEGSALMKKSGLIGDIIKEVSSAVDIPVSIKIRTGWDDDSVNAPKIAEIAEKNGAKLITVHGRTRSGMYFSDVDHTTIANVKKSVGIPVIGNGGIFNADDALKMLELTNCDGIAIGRGAQGNPFIFKQIKAALEGMEYSLPNAAEKINAAILHARMLVEDKGEYTGIREARKHIAWYLKGIRNSSDIRASCNSIETLDQLQNLLGDFLFKNCT